MILPPPEVTINIIAALNERVDTKWAKVKRRVHLVLHSRFIRVHTKSPSTLMLVFDLFQSVYVEAQKNRYQNSQIC